MKIVITYMVEDVFNNVRFNSDEVADATVQQLKTALRFFIDIKAKYTKLSINNNINCIENTVLRINKTILYFSSIDNFNRHIVTVKTYTGHNEYNVEEMNITDYEFKMLGQIRERNITDNNIDTLFV